MSLVGNQNVGVGTTTPNYHLDVSGHCHVTGNSYTLGNVGIGTTNPLYNLDVNGNSNVTGNSYTLGNVGIGTTTPNYSLDVNGNGSFNGYLLNKSIFFYSYTGFNASITYPVSVNQPLSYANKLVYQNLGGYSSSLYGFQTVAVGNIPAGAFIAPVNGIYTFYFRMRENDNGNLSDYYSAVNTNGNTTLIIHPVFKFNDGSNRRGVDSSIIVQLNQGQGFYYASGYVGNNIYYCYFGGKLEGTI